jgi:hypothetical protein
VLALVLDPGTNEQRSNDFGSVDSEGSTFVPALVPDPGKNEQLFKTVTLDQLILRGAHCVSSSPRSR